MKKIFGSIALALLTLQAFAQQPATCQMRHLNASAWTGQEHILAANTRSDTIDILHYAIRLDITDFTNKVIKGGTTIRYAPRMNNINRLDLDLLQLIIDSITDNSGTLTYAYNDTLLKINLPTTQNIGDTSELTVWYHGVPQGDPLGWGGFYFQSGYAYNLGVGFGADPHNYGRVWFPCFDNFVERSTYTFVIGSNNGKVAYCNGYLTADTTDVNNIRWRTWEMPNTIPSYLASVAVAGYTQVNSVFNSMNGPIPIVLTALPGDTTNMKNSFINLNNCLTGFENRFGAYEWNRVGYCLVPFNSGAMEHATNIAYPRTAANGTLTYEASIMAHELSHHWWGDLATCRTAEDMWLNEGWASYSSFVFTEWQYGRAAYNASVNANHDDMVHYCHWREGGFRAVSGVPHQYTYGDHVYNKGADVAHTLRGYMGDSLFWIGLKYHLAQSQYTDVSSADFRDNLITATGLTNLNDFFNDWVFNAGWPHFSIDSVSSVPNGPNYDVTVFVKQKLDGAPSYFNNVPLEVSFFDANRNRTTRALQMSGQTMSFNFSLPFNPVYTAMDFDEKISDALTAQTQTLSTTGAHNFATSRMNMTIQTISDTMLMRVEHHYVAPDPMQNNTNNYHLSTKRYWSVDGIVPTSFYATARFYYDGRTNATSGGAYYLDYDLTIPNGDSIILLYRRNAREDWREYPYYTKTITGASATSRYGYMDVDSLQLGEYCFANGVSTVLNGVQEVAAEDAQLLAYPNPAGEQVTVEWSADPGAGPVLLEVLDLEGRLVHSELVAAERVQLNAARWPAGLYHIRAMRAGKELGGTQVIIRH